MLMVNVWAVFGSIWSLTWDTTASVERLHMFCFAYDTAWILDSDNAIMRDLKLLGE